MTVVIRQGCDNSTYHKRKSRNATDIGSYLILYGQTVLLHLVTVNIPHEELFFSKDVDLQLENWGTFLSIY